MKILHIETFFNPTIGYQVPQFCRYHSKDFDVVIATSRKTGSANFFGVQELEEADATFVQETGVKIIRLDSLFTLRHKIWLRDLVATVRKERPDVIFAHGVEYLALVQLLQAGLQNQYPIVTDSHDLPTAVRLPFLTWIYRWFLKFYISPKINRHGITCYGLTSETSRLISNYGVSSNLIQYLPLGVDLKVYVADPSLRRIKRDEWQVSDSTFVVFYAGRIDYDKEPHFLIEALDICDAESVEKFCVIIAGFKNENYWDEVLKPLLAKPRSYRLEFIGGLDQAGMVANFNGADVAAFPKQNTLSALDAQACGLPVVMEHDVTNAERLEFGGMTYERGNQTDLVKNLIHLYENPSVRSRYSSRGMKFIRDNYSYEVIVKQLECDLLSEIEGMVKE